MPTLAEIRAERKRRENLRERERVARDADAIRARCETLSGFIREAWHVLEPNARYSHNWHIDAIAEHLEAVTDGRITRLLINVPPGSSKSLIVSVLWPAWEWGPRGMRSMRYLATSFNDGPVKRDTRKCRDLILSEWYQSLWPEVRLTRTAEMSFANSDTGTREGVAFGSLTSQRGDRLICLPYGTNIMTDHGMLPIGDIVENHLPVKVAGWNGSAIEWQTIEAYERNPPGEIFELSSDLGSFRCTGDHPVFILERGWVRADSVKGGETALYCEDRDELRNMREAEGTPRNKAKKVLQPGMLRSGKASAGSRGSDVPLRDLRGSDLPNASEASRTSVLFAEVQGQSDNGGGKSGLCRRTCDTLLCAMRRVVHPSATRVGAHWSEDLLALLRQQAKVRSDWSGRLVTILRCLRRIIYGAEQAFSLLLEKLCIGRSRYADEGKRQWPLCAWASGSPLSAGMDAILQDSNPGAGWERLSSLLGASDSGEAGAARPSYRLREVEPVSGKSDHGLQILPRDNAWETGTSRRVVETAIRSVKRVGFDGAPTYNVRVAPCHNYFAEGFLVHNCDDPHSVDTAESQTERANTTRRFREGAINRLNDQERSAIVVIMQRLHEDDIAGTIMKLGMGFERLILPMEYEPERCCATSIGFRDPRRSDGDLMDPNRFPRETVEALKHGMGSYAWASQYQQRPTPREGGMFKRHWFDGKIIGEAPSGTRWVRHWDLAATAKKTAARTAGVKIGRAPDGRFIVGHVVKTQDEGAAVRRLVRATAEVDGRAVVVSLPQDPGQAGKVQAQDFVAMLAGWVVKANPETGDKATRAEAFAAQCEAGNVYLVRGNWNESYLDELAAFPGGSFKDQVDASSGAFGQLTLDHTGPAIVTPLRI